MRKGGLKDGNGQVSTGSGGLKGAAYAFASRFESGGKTDPEELIAAAHAACDKAAHDAKAGCPISRLLNAKFSMDSGARYLPDVRVRRLPRLGDPLRSAEP